ncbi:MAG: site-specific integrase, partial [Acidimicrobiia bacterium]
MAWAVDDFMLSLTAASPHTRAAYRRDVTQFTEWCGRGGVDGPGAVDRLLLRRYLAFLTTKGLARPSIARKAAALRTYF